ncbi:DNA-processing protein DprA [Sulfuriroseicoccus oceanibius]|uniref:DNA-protecting protein DprA n=1 Tax=Sulfuriroseicoccus oceanibius TaxID=2707525 RepID=A0A6B3L1I6_9BACT|nr:DNA-processing protein DprA [Sulfuriroseicoccus oceanibius]QQL46163.1 DNA-protecting protein DprA [Sulfuriroseicoccus oceanibius]
MDNRDALLAFTYLPKVGPTTVARLCEAFGSPAAALTATSTALQKVKGIGAQLTSTIAHWRDTVDLDAIHREMESLNLRYLTNEDDEFPAPLRQIHGAPFGLFIAGELLPRDNHGIAVVGSRRCTHYGLTATRNLSAQIARSGLTVVSGLARGIDAEAHTAALEAGGRTIAVIGSGLGNIYPLEHKQLARRIVQEKAGAVLSEFPIRMAPNKQSFPLRNRIVSGMCKGLLVTECPAWSGAMITANLAAEQDRQVYAVPGPIDHPTSAGCHKLIQEGAKLTTCADDILEDLEFLLPPGSAINRDELPKSPPPANLTTNESSVYAVLDSSERHLDEIVNLTKLTVPVVSTTLMKLEIKRLAKQLPGNRYVKLV